MPEHGNSGKNCSTCPWPKDSIPRQFDLNKESDGEESESDGARPAKIHRVEMSTQTSEPSSVSIGLQTDYHLQTEECPICYNDAILTRFSCDHKVCSLCLINCVKLVPGALGNFIRAKHIRCPLCRNKAYTRQDVFDSNNLLTTGGLYVRNTVVDRT